MNHYFTDYAEKDRRLIFTRETRLRIWPWIVITLIVVSAVWDWLK